MMTSDRCDLTQAIWVALGSQEQSGCHMNPGVIHAGKPTINSLDPCKEASCDCAGAHY